MILSEIQRFLNLIFDSLDWDIVLFVGLGFQILLTIFFIIKSHFAYEMRVVKKLVKLNGWLSKNQYIDSNNLLEFNDLMKKTPKLLRYHWHQYMLYREKDPSFYMSAYNCIEKPLKTSSFKSNIKNYILMSYGFALFMFVLGVIGLGIIEFEFVYLAKAMLIPVFIIILNIIFVMILRARESRNLSALYQYFHYFNRFMDRAVTTMPPYVDFEVLFTASEIRKGIPVLNEYLEKRARQEQEELEKARLYAVEHETFDFAEAGLNGSLVLDRAMKEAETYLNIRQRLLSEIEQFDSEIDSLKRNYENTQREYEKKMQASKENVARLRQQQEESTNRIESNYIKKQQSDEIKKQEQLEKDHDSATVRFNQEMEVLIAEINSRKKDLEERRQYVEDAMKAEYQTFSLKMFKSISASLEDKTQKEKDKILEMKDEIVVQLEDAIVQISEKNAEINELRDILRKHRIKYAGYGNFESRKLQAETKKIRRGKKGSDEEIKDEFDIAYMPSISPEQTKDIVETNLEEEIVYDENGGYYDNEGNYRYKNGAYYDKDGIYHDEKGGWFEADGVTYHPPATDDAGEKTVVSSESQNNLIDLSANENKEIDEKSDLKSDKDAIKKQKAEAKIAKAEAKEARKAEAKAAKEARKAEAKAAKEAKTDSDIKPLEEFLPEIKGEDIENLDTIVEGGDISAETTDILKTETTDDSNFKELKEDIENQELKIEEENIDALLTQKEEKESTKKQIAEKSEMETLNDEVPATEKKKRGRPKKATSEEEPKVKRPRGRPRKTEINEEQPKVKRPRGRPKKVQTEEVLPVVKRPRGRPRKIQTEEVLSVVKRPRGRPKKEESSNELQLLNQQIADENSKLEKQKEEFKSQLDAALSTLDDED